VCTTCARVRFSQPWAVCQKCNSFTKLDLADLAGGVTNAKWRGPHCHDNSHAKDRKTKKNRKSTLKYRERRIVGEALARARLAEEVPCTASERVVGMDLQHRVQQHQSSAAAHAAFPAASPAASGPPATVVA